MQKFQNMYELFKSDKRAKHYFDRLPDYVRDQISTRAGSVSTFDNLKDYAENLTRQDD